MVLQARFRDKIVLHYFGIDFDIVWSTAENKLPELVAELVVTLQKMKVKKLNSQLTILTGHTTLAEQERNCDGKCKSYFRSDAFS